MIRLSFIILFFIISGCAPVVVGGVTKGAVVLTQERSSQEAAKDLVIKTKIEEALFSDNFDDLFSKVKVIVIEGRVLLVGLLNNNEDRDKAAKIAWNTSGVREVLNYTSVGKNSFLDYLKDSRIALEFRAKLLTDEQISEVNYTATTENAVLYVIGIAQNKEELNKVLKNAQNVPGVKKVKQKEEIMNNISTPHMIFH